MYILSKINTVNAYVYKNNDKKSECKGTFSVPSYLIYIAAKKINLPVKNYDDIINNIKITNIEESSDISFNLDDLIALNINRNKINNKDIKSARYFIKLFNKIFILNISGAIYNDKIIIMGYNLRFNNQKLSAVAVYSLNIDKNIISLEKLSINGKPKILVSCANECTSDEDCAPPDPDCISYCCQWNLGCLINCCNACGAINPCHLSCCPPLSYAACLLCLLIWCGIACTDRVCCVRRHNICAGHR